MSPGGGEERIAQKGVPRLEATGVVVPPDARVGVAEDARGRMQDVQRGVAPALVARPDEPPLPTQIAELARSGEVVAAVVLMKHPGAGQPQIAPGDHLALRVDHSVLWLDV